LGWGREEELPIDLYCPNPLFSMDVVRITERRAILTETVA
jgi:hypothetical protein